MSLQNEAKLNGATSSRRGVEEVYPTIASQVMDIEFLGGVDLFAATINDFSISFWESNKMLIKGVAGISHKCAHRIFAPEPQRLVRWHAENNTLYSCGKSPGVLVWTVHREKDNVINVRSKPIELLKHKDSITDIL